MEHRIREAKGTILIYKGEPICYNILNTFASYRTKCVDENRFQALKIKG